MLEIRTASATLTFAIACAAALFFAACGDDESACESTGNAYCAAACDCAGDGRCIFTDADGSTALTFESEADCKALFNLGCDSDEPPTVDFAACMEALADPACVATSDGMGLVSPAACEDDSAQ
jgi:hypothetical protein